SLVAESVIPGSEPEPGAGLKRLFELARASLPAPVKDDPRGDVAFARLHAGWSASHSRSPRWLVPAAAALAVAAGGGITLALRAPVLSFTVAGAPATEGDYVRADADTGLRFSDGTEVELERASGGQVASTGPHGARVRLDH